MKRDSQSDRPAVNLLYEFGRLKNVKRSGWVRAGIENPESVLDHSARVALTAFLLARAEEVTDPASLL